MEDDQTLIRQWRSPDVELSCAPAMNSEATNSSRWRSVRCAVGSVENRLRFLREVTEAVVKAWSPSRTGVRLSPSNSYNDMSDSDPAKTFTAAARALNDFNLAYLHVYETRTIANRVAPAMREAYKNTFILNGSFDAVTGAAALKAGAADAIAYGRLFIANPDLVDRFRRDAALNVPDPRTFYTSDAKGYTDYPALTG